MEIGAVRDKHFAFFFKEYSGVLPILRGPDQLRWLKRLQVERDNLRSALEWSLTSPSLAAKALELAGALFWYWTKRGDFEEGSQWLERALDANAQVRGAVFPGGFPGDGGTGQRALSVGREDGDAWAISFAPFLQGLLAFERGDYDQAVVRSDEAREAGDACGQPVQIAGPLMVLANVALAKGDHDGAQQFYDDSIDVARPVGEIWGLGIILSVAAGLGIVRQDFVSARAGVRGDGAE